MINEKLTLNVFTSDATSAMKQEDAPVDIHGCNAPSTRRTKILDALSSSSLDLSIIEIPTPADTSLSLAKNTHDCAFIDFLETAWDRWSRIENRCAHFFGMKGPNGIPSLIPGNSVNHSDACQRPGGSVYSQSCYYMADQEAPIFDALKPALASDLAVVRAVVDALDCTPGVMSASYALITHPGHHASRANCSGYCYINQAAVIVDTLRLERPELKRFAVIDVDYHAGNGTIGIFWNDPDVFVASIHAHPDIEYPYSCGFSDQVGGPDAIGATLCLPLGAGCTISEYSIALQTAVEKAVAHGAQVLVVSLGVDTLRNDPVAVPDAGFAIDSGIFCQPFKYT